MRVTSTGVKIAACLCWFDEPPGFLDRCVRSLALVADVLVAVDGPWEHYPYDGPSSPAFNYEEVAGAAEAVGLPVVLPDARVWGSQVEKRAHMLRLAHGTEAEWLMPIDGDEYIVGCDRPGLHAALDTTGLDVAQAMFVRTVGDPPRHRKPKSPRRLYRASTGVTVDTVHFGYRAADGRWLKGPESRVRMEPALDATGLLTFHHTHRSRGKQRDDRMRSYYRARRKLGLEDWQDGPWRFPRR